MSNLSESFTQSNTSDLLLLITQFVGNWKEFARCMNFLESQIRLIETHSKLQLSTEYASHFMKLFLDRKQDVTSWVFWCNLLNKFDDGKTCIEKIKSSELLVSSEDIFAEKHFELICNKIVDWRRFARYMKFNEEQIEEVRKDFKTIKGRNKFLMEQFLKTQNENSTWKFWKELLTKFDEGQICIKEIEEELQKFHIKNDDQSNGMIEEISNRISNWKEFARVMNFNKFEIVQVENGFKNIDKRCLYLMNTFVYREQDITSWMFWRNLLSKYEEGKLIIYEVEKLNNDLFCQGSQLTDHNVSYDKFKYMGHILEYSLNKRFNVDKNKATLAVQVGSSSFKFEDHQSFSEWVENQQRYMDTYNMFKDLKAVNFADLGNDFCPTLGAIKTHLEVTKDNGFVVKGYHYINHINKLKPGSFKEEINDNQYFCIFANDNIVLYVTKEDVPTEALYNATRNIQIANILHEELQSKDIVQVNVILHNENKEFCKQCFDNDFYVDEEVFHNADTFTLWYNDLVKKVNETFGRRHIKSNKICSKIKKDMITYEALETSNLPTFCYSAEDQMVELKKIVLLTSMQLKVLRSKAKFIVLKGCYGSGKSLVLIKKFEQVISSVSSDDIIYFICNDQQSQFGQWLKFFLKTFPKKNIICCPSKKLLNPGMVPRLSDILKHVSCVWKNTNVHLFIDEFDSSYFTKEEIMKLKSILKLFENSFIVISLQSMERYVADQSLNDIGYQFSLLEEVLSFSCFKLDYSLRCSFEINEFVKETSKIIESTQIKVKKIEDFGDHSEVVDKEYGMENKTIEDDYNINYELLTVTYQYNVSEVFGHSVHTGPVNVYHLDKSISDVPNNINHFYISTIEFLLNDDYDEPKEFVISTYLQTAYNFIYDFLQHSDYAWTTDIKAFINKKFTILLVDYASVRGYEFANFIFVAPLGKQYMKYRMIECITRTTSELHIISDNTEISDGSVDDKIINKWKELECVRFVDCVYIWCTDELKLYDGNEEIFLKRNISETELVNANKYPWTKPFLIKERAIPDSRKDCDVTIALKYIIEFDDVDLFLDFLKSNDINLGTFQDKELNNILCLSAIQNSVSIAKIFLDDFENCINYKNESGNTSLYLAAESGSSEVVKLLISVKHVEIDTSDNEGRTALHMAAKNGHLDTVKQLIENHASIYKKTKYEDALPIHYAAKSNNPDIIKLLLSQKKNNLPNDSVNMFIDASNAVDNSVAQKVVTNGLYDANVRDGCGDSPLIIAASSGNIEVAEALIKNNADINAQNNEGRTPFLAAVYSSKKNMLKFLIENNADIHIQDKHGNMAIHLATSDRFNADIEVYVDIVDILIENGANINAVNGDGNTPIHCAVYYNWFPIVQRLIESDVDINATNGYGDTPLRLAKLCKHYDIAAILEAFGGLDLKENAMG